ncbi:MAG: hypothetical protein ABIS50_19270 [Luteolibacter sp.]|uniref:hypothetical protein n=1 Tax=Luteolibacter sp. TaxID=1962973 RepID=UPI0032679994
MRSVRNQNPGKLTFLLLVFLLGSPFATARAWKNDTGQIIDADLVAVRGESAVLSRNGKEFVFPISKLSEEDRKFIKEWQAHPPVIPPRKLTFAGQPLETGGKVNMLEFDYSSSVLKELKTKYRSDETKFRIAIVVPANFDPAKPQHVYIPCSATNNPEEAKAGNVKVIGEYTKACLDNGWICLTTDSDLGITANFIALENAIEKLDNEWPNFRRWGFATGGFSGGGKGCYYVAAQLIRTDHRVIGTFMGACNEDWSAKCRDYLKAPIAGYRTVNTFLSVGKNDTLATPEICAKNEQSLHAGGITSTRLELFDGGHVLHKPHIDVALKWFVEKEAK